MDLQKGNIPWIWNLLRAKSSSALGLDSMQHSYLSITWRFKQQQTTEANGGGRAGIQEELYCTLLVCCCQSLCASQFIWQRQISARITLLYNFKDVLPFLQITNLKLIPKSKPFILQYFNFTLPYFGSFSALRLLK